MSAGRFNPGEGALIAAAAENQRLELTDVLEVHFIELAKVKKKKPYRLRTPFEKWLHVLKFGEEYEYKPLPAALRDEEGIEMAVEKMRRARSDDEVRELMELREKALHDEASQLLHAREAGRDEGRREGQEQGRREGDKLGRLAVARELLATGMQLSRVLTLTGLEANDLEQ